MASKTSSVTAPVAVLMFNRPDTTKRVLERVLESRPSEVFLIADGPRPNHPDDQGLCDETRAVAQSLPWSCPVHTLFADKNMGLRQRVTSGLDWVFEHVESAIVVEDDCLADASFFDYATELLGRYRDNEQIGVISGNNFLRGRRMSNDSYYFTPDVRIWGWATWRRVWQDFSRDGLNHQWEESELETVLGQLGSKGRARALRADAMRAHKINSWALPFVLHSLRRGYKNIAPETNLVTNVGFGADSTHTKFESFTAEVPAGSITLPLRHPERIVSHPEEGVIQDRVARLQWIVFPLTHPIEFVARVLRYLSAR